MKKYNWINANDYTMDCFLLFDRWALRWIFTECEDLDWFSYEGRDYKQDMAKALYRYPHVAAFCRAKAPECSAFLDRVQAIPYENWTEAQMREAETAILQAHETFVVYAYPDVMNRVNYIRNWDPKYLYELVDLNDKVVLDVGSGTGRLAFTAAKKAKRVYASEPCDCLREYMRDRIKAESITNMKVLDGEVLNLPYEDDTFDAVLSGHVVGDFYEEEIAEMTRITKDGGWLVICNGDDEFRREAPDRELTSRGFEAFCHESIEGGLIYNYRKQVRKKRIRLEAIDDSNWRLGLSVAESQRHYVSDGAVLLARAYAYRDARSHAFVIYDEEIPVGMGLYHDCAPLNAYDFSQLFIDQRYQGRGYGLAATNMVLNLMRQDGKYQKVVLCYIEGNDAAKHLYEKVGFRETDRDGDEIIMEKLL